MPDPNTIGQDKAYKDATDEYDAGKGSYTEQVTTGEDAGPRLPTADMPKAPDPSPFNLTPTPAAGGR